MLQILPPDDAKRLREFFVEAGYAEENLNKNRDIRELPSRRLRNLSRLMYCTEEPTLLNTLLRWFWVGVSVDMATATDCIPAPVLALLMESRLLRQEGSALISEAMVLPANGFLMAADHTARGEAGDRDFVLWPNPTSKLLSRFTVRRPSRATLDLGTGGGIEAIQAAHHSEKVVATDLNARAINFATFNARFNGVENVEFLTGDRFAPVTGRKFDLIVCNPPFFITPGNRYLFCDNPFELDELCRLIVTEAPKYLNEGGYFQMLFEWAETLGQTWQERIAEWVEHSNCDVWVMKGQTQNPSLYAQERIQEAFSTGGNDADVFAAHMAYYREKKVVAIHSGIIAMHRRSGRNWVYIQESAQMPKEPFGESVQAIFAMREFLLAHSDNEQLLTEKPSISPNARLEPIFGTSQSGWEQKELRVRVTQGFPFSMGVQPQVADFMSQCNGTRTLAELIQDLSSKVDVPPERVREECLNIVRAMIERGVMVCW